MRPLGDDHDPGDEDATAATERHWFPVMRPINSGQHVCPNMGGYPFGHASVQYDAEQHPLRTNHVALMPDGTLELSIARRVVKR